MRTTLTLDDDVASLLEREIRRTGASLKETVNKSLRRGLIASQQPAPKRFKVIPFDLGLPPGLSYDNVEALIEALEGPNHK
ncbi:MAG: antitoxin [Acidobacteriota bacterium]